MAPSPISNAEPGPVEQRLLDRLLGMYAEQQALYDEVLALSRRQRTLVREQAPLSEIRAVLERKQRHLATIRRLELAEHASKDRWQRDRTRWSASGRTRLHRKLEDLGRVIEEILACEEENDLELLQQCR
ncbi:hypothetical protein GF314_07480 [bacterium]|nr:hypothetical protein [bacterium]